MNKTQTTLLLALAQKLDKIERSKDSAIESLFSAGIVNRNGKITKSFPNLERILTVSE